MNTLKDIHIRELVQDDADKFLVVMQKSQSFHFPYITAPQTREEFEYYFQKSQLPDQRCYLAINSSQTIIGVFNISGIVRGVFQSAYLGYFANVQFASQGAMSQALKLVLKEIFLELKLHRIEANIQPTNKSSIRLITKNGFLKEGFSPRYLKINGQWCDHLRFALLYEDWLANQYD
ncbi:GNAT family N-acetyltransferase [Legionella hackeliae]|uniref:Ribosomal-protein-alanine acetyltransferase n=1 Tax=Legionella hackeliae TaxID=449 RepID=A0A0A8UNR5_LEGHA|nr:GNAT family protein [Legionella hackeliae]KTD14199.1 GNAT family acetyltransferase [Legionella hackeliae]CEK10408.1 Ribosomal-protein-alanine acetyltransferase [Legionella hackeliae]STX47144.1 GNAT family acetyltransferase [Legionella hackeliae]